ncbi:MAG TPA: FN3 associated domain-containing protein [Candidatus Dojkabacteria bacterium]|nr:FN3 associated domain-containing protein [Candidatus Dojkabacteria bacterium]
MKPNFKYIFVFLFLALTMSFISADLNTDLVAYWNFNENAGVTANDSTANNLDWTLSNSGSWSATGKISASLLFNNNYYASQIDDSDFNWNNQEYSFGFWIKTTDNTKSQLLWKRYSVSGSNFFGQYISITTEGKISFWTAKNTAGVLLTGNTVLNNNTWYYINCIQKSDGMFIYINGVLDNSNVTTYGDQSNNSTAYIGNDGEGFYKIYGQIDEYGIWNKALSESEILQLYNSGNGSTYPFSGGLYTPTASVPTGTYYDPFQVTLDNNSTVDIYYTLDGSTPDDTKTLYTEPININETKTLKAISWVSDENKSSVATYTYTIREPTTIITFRDENTLAVIPTVTITDANGSTYTSDESGVLTTSWSNIAKSLIISKTGYDSRTLQFYFKREDFDSNFLLTLDGNSVNIGFIVKDANDNLWGNKYLVFKKGTDIINSLLTSSSGEATASLLANGDYNALLYTADGYLTDTYEKTTVTVNKPKNEITLSAVSPYDITVGGLLGYSLTNQTASSVSFNIFAGTEGFYYFGVVDYNAVPADRKYLPRQYFTQVPMGTGYSSALTYQPYLLLETDAVVPKITVLDQLNKPIGDVDIFISRSINNVVTIVESGKTTSTGNMSFSAYPLEYYYINVIYNGVDKGTFRVQPRESTDNFIIVIDTSQAVVEDGELIITADFSGTQKVVNIEDSNIINADITITQNINSATSYNLYLVQAKTTKASTSGAISGLTTNIDYDFDSSVVDRFNNNLTLKLVVNYPDGNQTFYYTITATKETKGLMYFAPQIINDIGQPLGIILAILITAICLAGLTFSGLNISPTAITILGVLILGVFMFLGWLDTGITVLGFDIARFFYVLMAIGMVYFMMRGEQYA